MAVFSKDPHYAAFLTFVDRYLKVKQQRWKTLKTTFK